MKDSPEFKDLYKPLFTIEDVADVAKLPHSTLRMWPNRKVISLSTSYTPGPLAGRGTKALYSVYDAMQFLLLAEVTKDTYSVKALADNCLSEVLEVVLNRLSEMADGVNHGRNVDPCDRENAFERYVFLCEKDGKIHCTQEFRAWSEHGRVSWYTIDAIDLAAKVYAMYLKKTGTA